MGDLASATYLLPGGALGLGAALLAAGLVWLARGEAAVASYPVAAAKENTRPEAGWIVPLLLIVAVGAVLRLYDLDGKTLSHPEVYTPGIALPPGITEPPPRTGFLETVSFHWLSEPHPPGYYLAMWLWTKLFGTGLGAIRLTSALLGIGSLYLMFRVAATEYGHKAGLIAAGLLALQGFHIYWSQMARMYAPGCFLGLLATWLLLRMMHAAAPRRGVEAGYVATLFAGAATQYFFWILIGGHLLATLLASRDNPARRSRIGYFQALSLILSLPLLIQAFEILGRNTSGHYLHLRFVVDFLAFGFLFQPDWLSQPVRVPPIWAVLPVMALALLFVIRGLLARPQTPARAGDWPVPSGWPLAAAACGSCLLMVGLVMWLHDGRPRLLALGVLPLLALAVGPVFRSLGGWLDSLLAWLERIWPGFAPLASPMPVLAVAPPLALFALSNWIPLLAPRAALIFVPYLLVLVAAGAPRFGRRRAAGAAAAIGLVALFSASVWHFRVMPTSVRDYEALAEGMSARMLPGDLVFTEHRDWATTPIFYYLKGARVVTRDFGDALAAAPEARVWVVNFDLQRRNPEMAAAFGSDYRKIGEVSATRARSWLYAREGAPDGRPPAMR